MAFLGVIAGADVIEVGVNGDVGPGVVMISSEG
jgi:hypothetical protein